MNSDNIITYFEMFHFMKNKRHGKEGCFALKLDMSKAYDRVEWGFLKGVMEHMGMPYRFIDLIMRCIPTVSYSVLINGQPTVEFCPTRGLRQGDPLSPNLFVLCAECLSELITRVETSHRLTGMAIS